MKTSRRYVLIRGQVFRWEEKEPFVASGKSVYGAMELDREGDRVRCHKCGRWVRYLGSHIVHHGLTASDYKDRYGLRRKTVLASPGMAAQLRSRSSASSNAVARLRAGLEARKERETPAAAKRINGEIRNEMGRCAEQLRLRIQRIAEDLKRTPTSRDVGGSIYKAAREEFGSWERACTASGLEPIDPRHRQPHYPTAILVELLRDFYVLNGRVPRTRDCGKGGLPADDTFSRRFGSFRLALVEAGLGLVNDREAASK